MKTKLKLIRYIAKEFGVTSNGRYSDVYEDLVAYLRTIDTPLVILNEAGDLQYEAFLESSALERYGTLLCLVYDGCRRIKGEDQPRHRRQRRWAIPKC